jgi:hypothetical protein
MTDATEPQAERASLFSGRLEAARRSGIGQVALFMVCVFATLACSDALLGWQRSEFNSAFARLATYPLNILCGLPIAFWFFVVNYGTYTGAGLKEPKGWYWSSIVISAIFVPLIIGGEIWMLLQSPPGGADAILITPLLSGVIAAQFPLHYFRARGWRWRR